MSEFETYMVEAGDHQIHISEIGEGEPLVMIHGGGAGASGPANFEGNALELSKHYRVILPDLVGYGKSTVAKPKGPRVAFYSKGIVDALDAMGLKEVNLLGNSLGGAIATWIGIHRPDLVRKLVLMGPGIAYPVLTPFPTEGWKQMAGFYKGDGPSKPKMRAMLETMVFDPGLVTDELVEKRFAVSTDPDVLATQPGPPTPESPFEMMEKEIEQLDVPALVVWGRDDRVTPYDSFIQFFSRMKRAELHVFSECGHWVQIEKRDEFNRVVLDYLAR
ncbi:MAG: alpha/beta fold hydrolase [Parvibaculaceae bacterium]